MIRLALLIAFTAPLFTDDWTGKKIKPKTEGIVLGRKLAGGLVREGATLETGKTYLVKSDDGTYLELPGGFIFKHEADAVADAKPIPTSKAKDSDPAASKGEWFGKRVLPKRDFSTIRIGDWVDGKPAYWTPHDLLNSTVREDRDGFLRLYDGRREGWVDKDDMVTEADATIWWDKAVKANPKDTFALNMRGAGWFEKGDFDKAIKDFTEVLSLKPDSATAYNNRGKTWNIIKEYDKAIADYTEALRLDPRRVTAYICRGIDWCCKKEYDKSIADYTEALRLDPKDVYVVVNSAKVFIKQKKYDKAFESYEKAMELNPLDEVKADFAWFKATCPDDKYRDGKKAVELAKMALEKAGPSATWHYHGTLAAAQAEAGAFELAISEQRKAIELLKAEKFQDKDDLKKAEARLELYRAKKPYRDEES